MGLNWNYAGTKTKAAVAVPRRAAMAIRRTTVPGVDVPDIRFPSDGHCEI